jgi:transcription initiation factor TFIIB
MPTSLARHDMGLATIIGRINMDASGHALDPAMRTTMERLRIWDIRTQVRSSTDRNLRNAFNQLEKLKDRLGISDVAVEKAAYLYRKAQERGLVRGRTIPAVLAAAA